MSTKENDIREETMHENTLDDLWREVMANLENMNAALRDLRDSLTELNKSAL